MPLERRQAPAAAERTSDTHPRRRERATTARARAGQLLEEPCDPDGDALADEAHQLGVIEVHALVEPVPVAQVSNIVQSIHRLQEEGFWVCAATEHTDDLVWNANLKGKIAIVLGNEHDGVSRLVLEHCDMYAKLPLEGEVASLNVAQAATAVMYEWLRQNIHTA